LEADNLVTHQTVNVESFATAIVKCVDQVAYNRTVEHGSDELPFAGYIAPEEFAAPHATERKLLSASELLKDPAAARKYLGGRIIIVSGNWSSRAFGVGPRVDLHASPVGPVPGAMIHANYVEAMLNDRAFSPVPEWFVVAIELLAVLLLAIVMALHLSAWAEVATVVGVTLFFLVANFFLQDLGRFFDFFVPLVILLGDVAAEKIIGWRKAAQKQQAHGHAA
jgi:CHASE2 domain-containing sensor protein